MSTLKYGFLLAFIILAPLSLTQSLAAKSITIAIPENPKQIDFSQPPSQSSQMMSDLLHCSLLFPESNGTFRKQLAKTMSYPDKHSILFELNPAQFSDGQYLTSDDIVSSYKSKHRYFHLDPDQISELKEIKKIDRHRLSFTFNKGHRPADDFFILPIYPKSLLISSKKISPGAPGCGPFHPDSILDNLMTLTANKFYYLGLSPKSKVSLIFSGSSKMLLSKFSSGTIDFALNQLNPTEIRSIETKYPSLHIQRAKSSRLSYLGFNFQNLLLASKVIRRGIAAAIDRPQIMKFLLKGTVYEITHMNDSLPRQEKANVIREAQLATKNLMTIHKIHPRLEMIVKADHFSIQVAKSLAKQIEPLGLQVEIHPVSKQALNSRLSQRKFDIFLETSYEDFLDTSSLKRLLYSTSLPPHGANYGHYNNQIWDNLIDGLKKSDDSNFGSPPSLEKIKEFLKDDSPLILLWGHYNIAVSSPKVPRLPTSRFTNFRFVKSLAD